LRGVVLIIILFILVSKISFDIANIVGVWKFYVQEWFET
jgi:hypothetical protein